MASDMEFQRELSTSVGVWLRTPAVVVAGARQTGKTTLRLFPDYRYVSLDLPSAACRGGPSVVPRATSSSSSRRRGSVRPEAGSQGTGTRTAIHSHREVQRGGVGFAGGTLPRARSHVHRELGDTFQITNSAKASRVLVRGFMPQLWEGSRTEAGRLFSSYQATERDVRQLLNVSSLSFDRSWGDRSGGHLLRRPEVGQPCASFRRPIRSARAVPVNRTPTMSELGAAIRPTAGPSARNVGKSVWFYQDRHRLKKHVGLRRWLFSRFRAVRLREQSSAWAVNGLCEHV